ncbi:uncharacterized protein LOC135210878 isoform X1 [Macrobrachium nipponense]|uniref:uncharacterized protein LOC135210878 isoform X1 n=1 Tax=Macrobrachium nipponense TaxID=159736 RepID=UPI0030C80865
MDMDSSYIKEEVVESTSVTLYLKEEPDCEESVGIKEEPIEFEETFSQNEDPIEPKQGSSWTVEKEKKDFTGPFKDPAVMQDCASYRNSDLTLLGNSKDSRKERNMGRQVKGGSVSKKHPCKYTSQSQNIIMNVYEYFCEKSPHITVTEQEKMTVAATKVSLRTVQRIKAIMYRSPGGKISSPEPPIRHSSVMDNLDEFDRECVRREILSFYERNEFPTVNKLLKRVRDPPLSYAGSRSSLYKLVKNIGFNFRKVQSGRAILMEKEDIVAARNKYLRELKTNRESSQPLQEVYLDETWVTDDETVGSKFRAGKGGRFILVHAGGHQGFIPGAFMVLRSKDEAKGNNHEAWDYGQFKSWFELQLLPNLQERSLIVMDNAPHHSKVLNKMPTNSSTKCQIIQWLEANNIPHDSSFTKGELLYKCRQHKEKQYYEIDQIAADHGHMINRLPPYSCMLNPIELIWAQVEHEIKNRNSNAEQSLESFEQIAREAIQEVTSELWQKCIQHSMKIEENYRNKDRAQNLLFEKFVIDVHSDESSEESSDELMET